MRIHFIFNTNRLKLYYKKISEIKKNQSKVVKEIKEWKVENIQEKKDNKFFIK